MYHQKIITVFIPALNEESTIGDVIDHLPDFVDYILVVNDGSTDKTAELAQEKGAIIVSHDINLGVGAAFQTGIDRALQLGTDIMVSMDADGQFNPDDIQKLINPIVDESAEFVTATRFKNPEFNPVMPRMKIIGNKFMAALVSRLCRRKFSDVSCGFRAYSRDTLLRLNLFGDFTYTQETFLNLVFNKISIREIPVKVRGERAHGKSRVANNLIKYGWQTAKIVLKTFRDYKPFRLFFYISTVLFFSGLCLGIFFMVHFFSTGSFSPHKWAGFTSAFLVILSFLSMGFGFILDMFARMRRNQEKILFIQRKLLNEKEKN